MHLLHLGQVAQGEDLELGPEALPAASKPCDYGRSCSILEPNRRIWDVFACLPRTLLTSKCLQQVEEAMDKKHRHEALIALVLVLEPAWCVVSSIVTGDIPIGAHGKKCFNES